MGFKGLILCTKRLLADCSTMQYSHPATRLDSIGICNVALQEEGEGGKYSLSQKKSLVKHTGLSVLY